MIARITKVYQRHYRDNGQTTLYVEWVGNDGKSGRIEGDVPPCLHMWALICRAAREGVNLTCEIW